MKWTLAHIEKLKAEGKIRGYTVLVKLPKKEQIITPNGKIVSKLFGKKSKEKQWIEAQLFYWAQEHCYNLKSEFRFHDTRKWRFDWCIEELKIAIEYEGGIFNPNGDHRSVKGISRDIEKYNAAAVLGWKVFRFTALNYQTLIAALNFAVQHET